MALSLSPTLQGWISQNITTGLPSPPPTGVSACTAGLLCRRCWASMSLPPAAFAAADWCLRLHGWPIMPPLFWASTSSPSAAFAAADWCLRLHGWPIMPSSLGVYIFTDRLAFAAANWCLRLHGWPIMPPLLGVYVFTDRLAFAAADCLLCRRRWASTSSPTGLPLPPPTGVFACTADLLCRRLLGVYAFTDWLAFAAADCLLCCRCSASSTSLTSRLVFRRLVSPPARLAYYAAVVGRSLCRRCWASTTSPPACLRRRRLVSSPIRFVGHTTVHGRLRLHRPACLRRRRLVSSPARLTYYVAVCWASTLSPIGLPSPPLTAYYATVVRRHRLHRPVASSAADWCLRLHGWPIMPPSLGVYIFTDRLAFAAANWCLRLHGWPIMSPLLGVYIFTDRLAFAAADWCLRLHGWPIMPPSLGVYVFTASCLRRHRLVSPPARLAYYAAVVLGVYVFTVGCLRRRRLVSPPTRLAYYAAVVLGVYVFTAGSPSPPSTGVSACTAVMPPSTGVFIFTTIHLRYRFATSPTTTSTGALTSRHASTSIMPCYFTSGVPIFKISTRTSSMRIFTQAMTTRRQEATVLDSIFSCFSTNQRVGGYINTRLSKFDKLDVKMKQSINQRVNSRSYYLRLRFRADI
uniref:cysteine dioxygenase n=1 Tax=Oryza sativa subsp. japonica TaxID=39947 RepID=Q9AUP4_ORYSJ|nr:Hypothetical protein [Oryza sativa Japonica Group]